MTPRRRPRLPPSLGSLALLLLLGTPQAVDPNGSGGGREEDLRSAYVFYSTEHCEGAKDLKDAESKAEQLICEEIKALPEATQISECRVAPAGTPAAQDFKFKCVRAVQRIAGTRHECAGNKLSANKRMGHHLILVSTEPYKEETPPTKVEAGSAEAFVAEFIFRLTGAASEDGAQTEQLQTQTSERLQDEIASRLRKKCEIPITAPITVDCRVDTPEDERIKCRMIGYHSLKGLDALMEEDLSKDVEVPGKLSGSWPFYVNEQVEMTGADSFDGGLDEAHGSALLGTTDKQTVTIKGRLSEKKQAQVAGPPKEDAASSPESAPPKKRWFSRGFIWFIVFALGVGICSIAIAIWGGFCNCESNPGLRVPDGANEIPEEEHNMLVEMMTGGHQSFAGGVPMGDNSSPREGKDAEESDPQIPSTDRSPR